MKPKNPASETTFSYTKLFSKAISYSTNTHLLLWQGMLLALSLFAFAIFTSLMMLVAGLTTVLSFAFGFWPLALFVIIFGFAVWVLGMLAINAFMNGVQFHLSMQAVAKRPLDINLAWKLASARWRDSYLVQGSVLGFIVIIFILSLALTTIVSGNADVVRVLMTPSTWFSSGLATILSMGLLFVALEPFLLMMLPVVYFENVKAIQITQKLRSYVLPHYFQLLGTLVLLLILNVVVSSIADYASTLPFTQLGLGRTILTFVIFSGFGLVVQAIALLFTFTVNLNVQTLLYLHIGKPQTNTQFVTTGTLSTALSKLARSHPSHTGMLPVKWKKLGAKRKR
jgi:hypothetical protein